MPDPHAPARPPLAVRLRERLFLLGQRRRLRRIAAYHQPPADVAALVARLEAKRLVVALTAGRSGSTYLARLLAALPDITCQHEAPPHYVYMLRLAQHRPEAARRFLLEYKLPRIAAAPTHAYAEVSHLFCKGFLEPMLELGVVPDAITLRRPPREVAVSWLTRDAIPGRNRRGLRLHVHPGDPGVLPLPRWWTATDYQLCFWYALEIERRQRLYGERLTALGATVVDVTAAELHDPARFLAMVTTLGLFAADAHPGSLLAQHAQLSAARHKPNPRRPVVAPPEEEAAVWEAVSPVAPWLRDVVESRYEQGVGAPS